MRRLNSTSVVVAGDDAEKVIGGLGGLHNVRTVATEGRPPAELTDIVARASATYVVHDADPLGAVQDAWVSFFDETVPYGGLEVAIESVIAELRTERVVLPDYYVVLDPESMPATRRHWWLGFLAGAAPTRVVSTGASVTAVQETLAHLTAGRYWPSDLETWLRRLPKVVPDQVGKPTPGP
jgi:hypothetical protein